MLYCVGWAVVVVAEGGIHEIFERELNKQTLFVDRNTMTPHYTPAKLPFREKQIEEIGRLVALTLSGKRPDNLFVYGKPGTGKTSTARHVLEELMAFAAKRGARVRGIYVNCRTHNSKYKVLIKCLKELYPQESFLGFSGAFLYEKLLDFLRENKHQVILALDELDKVKDLDELVYALTRCNDELTDGSVSILGISNNLMFKDRLDPRTKSSLCKQEMVFPPYNAEELKAILEQRVQQAFKPNVVQANAINLASAIAAQESGDARTAVMLMLRAGEIAEKEGLDTVREEEVRKARTSVEEEIILSMVSTLPEQEQIVLYAIACLALDKKGTRKLSGEIEEGILYSGEVYEAYQQIARQFKEDVVSARWYREYVNELEMYGLILTTNSGKGMKGQTRFIKLTYSAPKIKEALERELLK
ncbi:MAG: AAA family ATPase [Candidatus Diapherotrites archaeon]|nr:AAA family ATPase [Candidatus Diapherotrites archaeon]